MIHTYHQDESSLLNLKSSWISRDILQAARSPHENSCPLQWSNDSALSETHTLINAILVCNSGSFGPITLRDPLCFQRAITDTNNR